MDICHHVTCRPCQYEEVKMEHALNSIQDNLLHKYLVKW